MKSFLMRICALALVSSLGFMVGEARAASKVWTGAVSVDWGTSGNWSPAGVPGTADTVAIGQGKTVNVASNVTVANLTVDQGSTIQGGGTVTVTSTGTATDATFDGMGAVSIPAGGVFNLNHGNNSLSINFKRKLVNSGTLNVNHPSLNFQSDVQNNAGGVIDFKADSVVTALSNSTPALSNAGLLRKSGGIGTSSIAIGFTNSGTVEAQSGTLQFGKGFTQTAGVTNLNGGHITVVGTMYINGGDLQGIGTITGNVVNNSHVKPGHSPGSTTINGNYTQSANGALDMEIGGLNAGTQYDQLIVNGTCTLDGTLNIIMWNGWLPNNGDNYQLLTYYSSIGSFTTRNGLYPGSQRFITTTLLSTEYIASGWVDSVAPGVTVTAPVLNKAYSSLTTATGTASDSGNGGGSGIGSVTVVLYRYAVGKTAAGYWAGGTSWTTSYSASNERPATGTTSWSLTLPTLAAGQYYLRATAKDKVGNTTTSANIEFWIDSTVPASVAFTSPASGATVGNLNTISGTAADNSGGSGIARVDLLIKRASDNTYWTGSAWSATSTPLSTTLSGTTTITWTRNSGMPTGSSLPNGSYSLTATAYDKANLSKAVTITVTVLVDTVAPTVSITKPLSNTVYTSLPSATGTAADNSGGSGLNTVTVMLYRYATAATTAGYWSGGTSWTTSYSASNELLATGTTSWSLTLPTLTYGDYYLRATAKDKANNATIAESWFSFSNGTSTISLSTASATSSTNKVTLTFTGALDATVAADPASYAVTVNGAAVAVPGATYSATTYMVTLTLPSGAMPVGSSVVAKWVN
ncbi:MAG: Ig-like domain-containing protein, partial [Armatimonadota bacterium]|nr:Ig-like domain-containing protein [Armatimonadota bacterium]